MQAPVNPAFDLPIVFVFPRGFDRLGGETRIPCSLSSLCRITVSQRTQTSNKPNTAMITTININEKLGGAARTGYKSMEHVRSSRGRKFHNIEAKAKILGFSPDEFVKEDHHFKKCADHCISRNKQFCSDLARFNRFGLSRDLDSVDIENRIANRRQQHFERKTLSPDLSKLLPSEVHRPKLSKKVKKSSKVPTNIDDVSSEIISGSRQLSFQQFNGMLLVALKEKREFCPERANVARKILNPQFKMKKNDFLSPKKFTRLFSMVPLLLILVLLFRGGVELNPGPSLCGQFAQRLKNNDTEKMLKGSRVCRACNCLVQWSHHDKSFVHVFEKDDLMKDGENVAHLFVVSYTLCNIHFEADDGGYMFTSNGTRVQYKLEAKPTQTSSSTSTTFVTALPLKIEGGEVVTDQFIDKDAEKVEADDSLIEETKATIIDASEVDKEVKEPKTSPQLTEVQVQVPSSSVPLVIVRPPKEGSSVTSGAVTNGPTGGCQSQPTRNETARNELVLEGHAVDQKQALHAISLHSGVSYDRLSLAFKHPSRSWRFDRLTMGMLQGTIEYDSERRLALVRNVSETRQSMNYNRLQYTRSYFKLRKCFVGYIFMILMTLLSGCLTCLMNWRWMKYAVPLLIIDWVIFLCCLIRYRSKTHHINFIPHLLSSILYEVNPRTNDNDLENICSSLIARNSTLPIRDTHIVEMSAGTTLMARAVQATRRLDFQSRRVVYTATPLRVIW